MRATWLNGCRSMEDPLETAREIMRGVGRVIVGKQDVIRKITVALLCGGHVLIEGFPGTAKTMLAKAFAKKIGGVFKRIQFTPDTLPTDVTGFHFYNISTGEQVFRKGPVFANIVLADEINRSSPRTQAALLEAMQEKQVTVDGITYPLPRIFMVIATQVPYRYEEGVYPLPITQLDRFMMSVWSGYSDPSEEVKIILRSDEIEELDVGEPVGLDKLVEAQEAVKQVEVSEEIAKYIINLVNYVRGREEVLIGASHRASVSLFRAARANAFIEGRDYVIPDDVKLFAHPVLDHRIKLTIEAEVEGLKPQDIVEEALRSVEVPK